MKIDWKSKLSSRRFWCVLAGFTLAVLTALDVAPELRENTEAVMAALGILAVYIFGESAVDAAREKK